MLIFTEDQFKRLTPEAKGKAQATGYAIRKNCLRHDNYLGLLDSLASLDNFMEYCQSETPEELAQHVYDATECGASIGLEYSGRIVYLSRDSDNYEELPEDWLDSCIGIRFTSIVEDSDAEPETDNLKWPLPVEELEDAVLWLEREVDDIIAQAVTDEDAKQLGERL